LNRQDSIGGKSKRKAGSSWAKATFSSSLNSQCKLNSVLDVKKMVKKTVAIALFSFLTLETFPTASLAQTVGFSNSQQARQDSTVNGNNNNVTQNINVINVTHPRFGRSLNTRFNPVGTRSNRSFPQNQEMPPPLQMQAPPPIQIENSRPIIPPPLRSF
jgi:hypothetical protein